MTVEGYVPGMCSSTRLLVGDKYVIMAEWLAQANDVFKAGITAQVDWDQLPEYTRACHLIKMYPLGTTKSVQPFSLY